MQWQACRKSNLYRYRSNGSISIEKCSTACFLHPTGNMTAHSHIQQCPSLFDTQWCWWVYLASPGSLVLRWRGWMGKLPEQEVQDWGYRTMNTGCSGLFKPWAWLWSFVRNWVRDNWKLKLWDYSLPLFLILLLAIVSSQGSQKAGEEI